MSHGTRRLFAQVQAWALLTMGCVDKGDDLFDADASVATPDAGNVVPLTGIAALPKAEQSAVCMRLVDTIKQVVVPFAHSECTELSRREPVCSQARDACVPGQQESYDAVWQSFDCVNTPETVTAACGIAAEEFDGCLAALRTAYAALGARVTCTNTEVSSPPHPQLCTELGERCPDLAEFGL